MLILHQADEFFKNYKQKMQEEAWLYHTLLLEQNFSIVHIILLCITFHHQS